MLKLDGVHEGILSSGVHAEALAVQGRLPESLLLS